MHLTSWCLTLQSCLEKLLNGRRMSLAAPTSIYLTIPVGLKVQSLQTSPCTYTQRVNIFPVRKCMVMG